MKKVKLLLCTTMLFLLLSAVSALAVDTCSGPHWVTGLADVPANRSRAVGATVGDKFYLIGGAYNDTAYDTNYAYSPIDDTWETLTSIPVAPGHSCGTALGTDIYVIGGGNSLTLLDDVQVYDTLTDSWSTAADLPIATAGVNCATLDGKIYVSGGISALPGTYTNAAYVYDPDLDSWTALTSMPGNQGFGSGAAFDGRFFSVGGFNVNTVYEYDPTVDGWTTKATALLASFMNANLVVRENYSSSDVIFSLGAGNNWAPDGTLWGFHTDSNFWYDTSWPTVPNPVLAAGSDSFHNAYFMVVAGSDASAPTDYTQAFNYCAPYAGPMDPGEMYNFDPATDVTMAGLNFDDQSEHDFYLEGPAPSKARVDFTDLTVVDAFSATATVPTGLDPGWYDLVVVNSYWSGSPLQTYTRENAFLVEGPEPVVSSITPDNADIDTTPSVTIAGDNFFGTPTVTLSGPAKADIDATNVVVTGVNEITCDFDLTGAAAGGYDVIVSTDNGDGTLTDGFTVNDLGDDDDDDDTADDDTADDDAADDDDDDTTPDEDDDDDDIADDDDDDDDDGCGC